MALNDAMILPYDANPRRIGFSERTPVNFYYNDATNVALLTTSLEPVGEGEH